MLGAIGNRQTVSVHEVAYPSQGKDVALACPFSKQLIVHSMAAYNGAVVANDIGVGYQLASPAWQFYQIVAGVATNATTGLQAGSSTNIFNTTANDGFYVSAKLPFNLLYLNLSQAQSGSPVYDYSYWNGSAFVALPLLATTSYSSTGATYVAFLAPIDWVAGNGSLLPTIQGSAGFTIRVRSTTAGGQAVIANAASVAKFFAYREDIASKQHLQVLFERPITLESGEGLIAYYSSANASNLVDASYQLEG